MQSYQDLNVGFPDTAEATRYSEMTPLCITDNICLVVSFLLALFVGLRSPLRLARLEETPDGFLDCTPNRSVSSVAYSLWLRQCEAHTFCFANPGSITYTIPSIVSDVSAMLVATIHLRALRPSGSLLVTTWRPTRGYTDYRCLVKD